jgi:3-deoxy-manno-octulosonate cytidylyltransferase (CMP-KDO synthetase)
MTNSTASGLVITAVIPARMASSRYPGKPLVPILGLLMIEHVRRRTLMADGVDHVVVATCDASIKAAVETAGGRAVMTRDTHERCTDRVEEAMQYLPGDIVAMVQGDEPLLIPEAVRMVTRPLLDDASLDVVNLLSPLESEADYLNPNIVKAVCNLRGDLMHLTRAAVPHFRKRVAVPVYRQTGIMAFRTSFLHRFSSLPETQLERAESVDMLRVLEHGIRLAGVVVEYNTLGVDRPTDIPLVEAVLRDNAAQRALFERTQLMGRGS